MIGEPKVELIPAPGRDYYAVVVDGTLATIAEVTFAAFNSDGDLVRPTTIQFIWTPPKLRQRGYAGLLVEHLRLSHPDLSHDGHLSADGSALVERFGLPMRSGKQPEQYDERAAEELGLQTFERVRAAWDVCNRQE